MTISKMRVPDRCTRTIEGEPHLCVDGRVLPLQLLESSPFRLGNVSAAQREIEGQ